MWLEYVLVRKVWSIRFATYMARLLSIPARDRMSSGLLAREGFVSPDEMRTIESRLRDERFVVRELVGDAFLIAFAERLVSVYSLLFASDEGMQNIVHFLRSKQGVDILRERLMTPGQVAALPHFYHAEGIASQPEAMEALAHGWISPAELGQIRHPHSLPSRMVMLCQKKRKLQ